MKPFGTFLSAVTFFHVSEFVLASIYMRKDLSRRSWLISEPYCVAMLLACLEYWLEIRYCSILKFKVISRAGLAGVITGEVIRKTAMVTAKHNFTHDVKFERQQEHVLVTQGIYRYCRHPGYLGWLVWVLGTQALLANPICLAGFSIVAWKFFQERIAVEEQQLRLFFGESYSQYAAKTPTLIPFIR
ncbi:hypothetical protein ABBQ32_013612 [Trebouxia sp. C0010 RCD-2024]